MKDEKNDNPGHEKDKEVTISINSKDYSVTAGTHKVKELKRLASIPLTDDFEEVVHGELKPLPNEATVKIKGGEEFHSHPHDGGSS